jgi:hypothetical protein
LQRKNGNYIYYRGEGEAIARQKAGAEHGGERQHEYNKSSTDCHCRRYRTWPSRQWGARHRVPATSQGKGVRHRKPALVTLVETVTFPAAVETAAPSTKRRGSGCSDMICCRRGHWRNTRRGCTRSCIPDDLSPSYLDRERWRRSSRRVSGRRQPPRLARHYYDD